MTDRRPDRAGVIWLCLALSLGFGLPLAAMAEPAPQAQPTHLTQHDSRLRINTLIRAGQRAAALPLCRRYTQTHPHDAIMLYNLACLENTEGHTQQAADAYIAALAAGFTAHVTAANDPDLQGDIHTRIVELNYRAQTAQHDRALANDLTLEIGTWSPPRKFPTDGPEPTLRLRWQDAGLECEFTAQDQWAQMFQNAVTPPWRGGPGLFIELAILPDDTTLTSSNSFVFSFGMGGKSGAGSIRLTARNQWQQVRELAPKIRVDQTGNLRLTAMIPWDLIAPYHPVTDTPLGVNATIRRETVDGPAAVGLIRPLPAQKSPGTPQIYAPLRFRTDSMTGEVFTGTISNSLSHSQPLELKLVAISTAAGEATLTLDFLDPEGHSVLSTGPVQGISRLQQGTNRMTRRVDFSNLADGGYLLRAELTFPAGSTKTWETSVLQLGADWQEQYARRIALVPQPEQATVRYLLDTTGAAVAHHPPRRNPGPIITTLYDLEKLLAGVKTQGTILPAHGNMIFIYPGPDNQPRVCHLYLPASRDLAAGLNPVLVCTDRRTEAARIAERIGRNYEFGKHLPVLKGKHDNLFPVYLVPELSPDPTQWMAEVAACRKWALTYFHASTTAVAGVDVLGDVALQMLTSPATNLSGLLIFSGANLAPTPLPIKATTPVTPITWLVFSDETTSAHNTRKAMREQGYHIVGQESVPGGLALGQIADHIVLWAEALR